MKKRHFWLGGFIAAWLMCIGFAVQAAAGDAFFDPSLGEFPAELKAAQKEGKAGLLLVFEAEGCPFCRRMREQVLSQPEVQRYFRRHFTIQAVDINGSVMVTDFSGKEVTEKAFALAYKVRGTPTFVFVGPEGQTMARHAGMTRDADEFLALGRYVVEGHWRKMSFEQYRQAK
ncbi:MAG: thioredoxin family protein [Rhodocyclaceae bacterium]|nr:thioredoxin family protein [Rhodocyclaceae bacterium]